MRSRWSSEEIKRQEHLVTDSFKIEKDRLIIENFKLREIFKTDEVPTCTSESAAKVQVAMKREADKLLTEASLESFALPDSKIVQ